MTLFVTSVRCHRTMYLHMLGAYDAIRDVSTMPSYYVSHMLGAYDVIRNVSTMPSYYVSTYGRILWRYSWVPWTLLVTSLQWTKVILYLLTMFGANNKFPSDCLYNRRSGCFLLGVSGFWGDNKNIPNHLLPGEFLYTCIVIFRHGNIISNITI